jgi:FMN phosphatase YigB (HAD superfamily)
MLEKISVIGFDFDGTLYPITPEIKKIQREKIYERISVNFGISLEESRRLFEKYYEELGSGTRSMEAISKKLQEPLHSQDFIQEALEQADFLDLLKPNPLLNEMLKRISKEKRLDLITGSAYNSILKKLEKIGISSNLFCSLFTHEDGSKSSQGVYLKWLSQTNLPPYQHLYVGDNPKLDMDIPQSLGIKTCIVGEYNNADFKIKDILELEDLFKRFHFN